MSENDFQEELKQLQEKANAALYATMLLNDIVPSIINAGNIAMDAFQLTLKSYERIAEIAVKTDYVTVLNETEQLSRAVKDLKNARRPSGIPNTTDDVVQDTPSHPHSDHVTLPAHTKCMPPDPEAVCAVSDAMRVSRNILIEDALPHNETPNTTGEVATNTLTDHMPSHVTLRTRTVYMRPDPETGRSVRDFVSESARNIPIEDAFHPDGTPKTPDELNQEFQAEMRRSTDPTIAPTQTIQ